jgi:hypothetical protein
MKHTSEGANLSTSNQATSKPVSATRDQLISDLKKINKHFPDAKLSRDFYRAHGKYADKAYAKYFPTFKEFVAATLPDYFLKEATVPDAPIPIESRVDLEVKKLDVKQDTTKKMLDEAVRRNRELEKEKEVLLALKDHTPQIISIAPKTSSGTSESVAVGLMSDWHIEEEVLKGSVSGLNEFNLEIAEKRATKAWQGFFRLYDILRRDTTIKTVIIFLGGDFITNTIHEDAAESNLLLPADAIYKAESLICSGLRFLLKELPQDTTITAVCHSGNHGRMTKKQRHATEQGNSLEQFMYYHIRDSFKDVPKSRLDFQIATGYHSYIRLFNNNYTIRFHHGHDIRYQGGVGGIYIPVNKAIAQWNKATRAVDLDCFGHFHTFVDASNFVANGSLIGYNAYAVSIKADYEKPQQAFFLINKKYMAKTMCTPIFVSED